MADSFQDILARFTPAAAEQIYGELYQFCASDEMDEAAARVAFECLLQWVESEKSPLAHSYGLLMLGGLIDSGKLQSDEVLARVRVIFAAQAALVDDYRILDDQNRFVHFVSHFAYLAGSCCEQFGQVEDDLSDVVLALVDLFLAAPDAYWCGEELLVARVMLEANLSVGVFDQMLDDLRPELVMQDADHWGDDAVPQWRSAMVRETHKRQLVMALQGLNLLLKQKPATTFKSVLADIVEVRFG